MDVLSELKTIFVTNCTLVLPLNHFISGFGIPSALHDMVEESPLATNNLLFDHTMCGASKNMKIINNM